MNDRSLHHCFYGRNMALINITTQTDGNETAAVLRILKGMWYEILKMSENKPERFIKQPEKV